MKPFRHPAFLIGNTAILFVTLITFSSGCSWIRPAVTKTPPPIEGLTISLGEFEFSAQKPAVVTISNEGADGYVVIDAVQWLAK